VWLRAPITVEPQCNSTALPTFDRLAVIGEKVCRCDLFRRRFRVVRAMGRDVARCLAVKRYSVGSAYLLPHMCSTVEGPNTAFSRMDEHFSEKGKSSDELATAIHSGTAST